VLRPEPAVWQQMLEAFMRHGSAVRKVAKVTGLPRDLVLHAWHTGWPGKTKTHPVFDTESGEMIEPGSPAIEALVPIHDIVERANLHARKARERIYKDTVKAQTQLIEEAHNDALRQRSLEAMAVRTALMLGDQAVKNALSLQLATVTVYESLAQKVKALADDPDKSAGAIMKVLREVGEVGRLATQQLETAMVLERKHLGEPEGHLRTTQTRSSDEVMMEIKLMISRALTDKMAAATTALEAKAVDAVIVETGALSDQALSAKQRSDSHVWSPAADAPDE